MRSHSTRLFLGAAFLHVYAGAADLGLGMKELVIGQPRAVALEKFRANLKPTDERCLPQHSLRAAPRGVFDEVCYFAGGIGTYATEYVHLGMVSFVKGKLVAVSLSLEATEGDAIQAAQLQRVVTKITDALGTPETVKGEMYVWRDSKRGHVLRAMRGAQETQGPRPVSVEYFDFSAVARGLKNQKPEVLKKNDL